MKKNKFIFLLVLLIVIAIGTLQRLPTQFAEAAREDFTRPELCLGQALLGYHRTMNDMFNEKIDLLTSGKPRTFVDKLPEIDLNTGRRKECEVNNITTFCVAREAVNYYESLLTILKVHQERVSDAASGAIKTATIDQELNALTGRAELIKREVENAKNAMDLALATYHEFRMAYPLHKKFEETYVSLEKFRDKMAEMRRLVSLYRYKFVDVTTTACQ